MILETGITRAETTQKVIGKNDYMLFAGEKAPFDGALVPEHNYRVYMEDSLEKEILERRLKELSENHPSESEKKDAFLMGIATGFIGFLGFYFLINQR